MFYINYTVEVPPFRYGDGKGFKSVVGVRDKTPLIQTKRR